MMIRTTCAILLALTIFGCNTTKIVSKNIPTLSYIPVDKGLYDEIINQDSALFVAFNTRNFEALKSFFSESLEVYQDNKGLRNYEQTLESFKALFKMDYVLTRQLVQGSVEVYPIKDFGAIQTGRHTFCHTENGQLECATYKFLVIWEKRDAQWKMAKLVTYDHKL